MSRAVECPDGAPFERGTVAICELGIEEPVVGILAFVVGASQGVEHLLGGRAGEVQGREGRLLATAFLDELDIAPKDRFGLRREVEDHVDVEDVEARRRLADAIEDLPAAAVFLVPVHLP